MPSPHLGPLLGYSEDGQPLMSPTAGQNPDLFEGTVRTRGDPGHEASHEATAAAVRLRHGADTRRMEAACPTHLCRLPGACMRRWRASTRTTKPPACCCRQVRGTLAPAPYACRPPARPQSLRRWGHGGAEDVPVLRTAPTHDLAAGVAGHGACGTRPRKMSRVATANARMCFALPCAEGIEGAGGKDQREYIEDVATGNFYRINHEGEPC